MRKTLLAIGVGIVAVAAAAHKQIGDVLVSFDTSRQGVRDSLRRWAVSFGLDPDWIDAIGKKESNWDLAAVNNTGPDAARGGAYGPTQITEKTARAYGYEGPMSAFNSDPELAAQWTCVIASAGRCSTFDELCGWWNAGSKGAAIPQYKSDALDALIYVQNHPPEA